MFIWKHQQSICPDRIRWYLYIFTASAATLCFSPPDELQEEDLHPGDSVGCSCCYNRINHLGSSWQMRASSFSSLQSSVWTKDEVLSCLSSASSFHWDCLSFLWFDLYFRYVLVLVDRTALCSSIVSQNYSAGSFTIRIIFNLIIQAVWQLEEQTQVEYLCVQQQPLLLSNWPRWCWENLHWAEC